MRQLNLLVPDAFSDAFRQRAVDDGGQPAHRVQALERVVERYGLHDAVRVEMFQVRVEAELRLALGRSAGGRARAAKLAKL